MNIHGLEAEKILTAHGYDPEIVEAIKMHNEKAHGLKRHKPLHHALAAAETITGMITATTLVYPDKRLKSVKANSVIKRMKQKAFAASVEREKIYECELIGFQLIDFAELSLNAMSKVSDELGL